MSYAVMSTFKLSTTEQLTLKHPSCLTLHLFLPTFPQTLTFGNFSIFKTESHIAQTGLKLSDPPASTSKELGLPQLPPDSSAASPSFTAFTFSEWHAAHGTWLFQT